jgi:hypothetical protein
MPASANAASFLHMSRSPSASLAKLRAARTLRAGTRR